MQVEIEFVEMDRSETLETRIKQELNKLEARYSWLTHAIVYLKSGDRAKRTCIVELEMRMPGNPIFVREENEKFSLAINKVFDVMRRQLEKKKDKMYSHGD